MVSVSDGILKGLWSWRVIQRPKFLKQDVPAGFWKENKIKACQLRCREPNQMKILLPASNDLCPIRSTWNSVMVEGVKETARNRNTDWLGGPENFMASILPHFVSWCMVWFGNSFPLLFVHGVDFYRRSLFISGSWPKISCPAFTLATWGQLLQILPWDSWGDVQQFSPKNLKPCYDSSLLPQRVHEAMRMSLWGPWIETWLAASMWSAVGVQGDYFCWHTCLATMNQIEIPKLFPATRRKTP